MEFLPRTNIKNNFCNKRRFAFVVGLLMLRFCQGATKPKGRYIVRVGEPQVEYQGLIASFGNSLQNDTIVNMMLPPDAYFGNPYLCEYPDFTMTNSSEAELNQRAANLNEPVALLVAVGGPCSTETKARVMLELQEKVSNQLQVLILYETNRRYSNWFLSLAPDSDPVPPELDKVAIIYFPFRNALELFEFQLPKIKRGSPYLLYPNNDEWSFEHSIERSWLPIDVDDLRNNQGMNDYDYGASDDYYWIRYVLFSLLIVSPCFRAGYLFYAGGGRIRFRRNERGMIVGLLYIPPMPYWLSHGRPPQMHEPVSKALTEEQFNSLPEIVYEQINAEEEKDNSEAPEQEGETEKDAPVSFRLDPELGSTPPAVECGQTDSVSELPLATGGKDGETDMDVDLKEEDTATSTQVESSPKTDGEVDVPSDSTTDETVPSSSPTTLCTECSICIDDFEPGERLILLPRCQHAFHKDCIKPWLLERQGRCPLCKTSVFQDENNETDGSSDNSSS